MTQKQTEPLHAEPGSDPRENHATIATVGGCYNVQIDDGVSPGRIRLPDTLKEALANRPAAWRCGPAGATSRTKWAGWMTTCNRATASDPDRAPARPPHYL